MDPLLEGVGAPNIDALLDDLSDEEALGIIDVEIEKVETPDSGLISFLGDLEEDVINATEEEFNMFLEGLIQSRISNLIDNDMNQDG